MRLGVIATLFVMVLACSGVGFDEGNPCEAPQWGEIHLPNDLDFVYVGQDTDFDGRSDRFVVVVGPSSVGAVFSKGEEAHTRLLNFGQVQELRN